MDDQEVWTAVDRQRSELVALLAGLTPEQWAARSLCEPWAVRDVAAHLTMPLLSMRQMLGLALRHPGGTNTLIREGSIDLGRRFSTDEILDRLRSMIGRHRHVPGLGCREALIDVLGHTYDIAVPLGIEVDLPREALAEAAAHVMSYGGRGSAKVFRTLPWQGRRLVATDHDWSAGAGPEHRDTMAGLFLLLIGRQVDDHPLPPGT